MDRSASDKEKSKANPTLKDNDFNDLAQKVDLGSDAKANILEMLKSDVELLSEMKLMDYRWAQLEDKVGSVFLISHIYLLF